MRRTRIVRRPRTPREERNPILPLDPRDPDVSRAKRIGRAALRIALREA